ncbi:hypothetical protein G3N56_02490 [Desulfovibrio sulfodismutans]|uniref:Uncharacterized protein n=1 Tax=Desulfolutivibrio sulfodismutans TaxID=63561 RepID=A0A7K3NHD4_9BACT|nr:hypothetical protein [Desulfolutivibrio sulfodismutans]NDY55611.1 hypothetical protein [Desulfolutivibrio sulfodismutans]QLA11687.1 hypothetical protein GD606_05070 [Desulfolutivibrio sulfodismutans DSM 3696]
MSKKESQSVLSTVKVRSTESKFDSSKLRQLIEQNKNADEMMTALNIKHKQTLKQYLLKLISVDRRFYEISGLNTRNSKTLVINSKGEIKIKKHMIDFPANTYSPGVQFDIEADNEKIVLRRVTTD